MEDVLKELKIRFIIIQHDNDKEIYFDNLANVVQELKIRFIITNDNSNNKHHNMKTRMTTRQTLVKKLDRQLGISDLYAYECFV